MRKGAAQAPPGKRWSPRKWRVRTDDHAKLLRRPARRPAASWWSRRCAPGPGRDGRERERAADETEEIAPAEAAGEKPLTQRRHLLGGERRERRGDRRGLCGA